MDVALARLLQAMLTSLVNIGSRALSISEGSGRVEFLVYVLGCSKPVDSFLGSMKSHACQTNRFRSVSVLRCIFSVFGIVRMDFSDQEVVGVVVFESGSCSAECISRDDHFVLV